jgi:hypothetical protein
VELRDGDGHLQDRSGGGGGLRHGRQAGEQTPLSMLALAGIMQEAGLADGVLNLVTTSDPGAATPPPQPLGRASPRPRRTAAHSGPIHVQPLPHDSSDAHDLISHHRSPWGIAPEDVICGATPDQAVGYRDRPHGVLDRHVCRGVIKLERPPHGSGREAPELPR